VGWQRALRLSNRGEENRQRPWGGGCQARPGGGCCLTDPRSTATRAGAGAVQNGCRWCGDLPPCGAHGGRTARRDSWNLGLAAFLNRRRFRASGLVMPVLIFGLHLSLRMGGGTPASSRTSSAHFFARSAG